jgi:hypothetical protein
MMPFHFVFSATEILWTLTFAAELVLLVVLMGRDRVRRFPWFTTSIALMATLELVRQILSQRISQIAFASIVLTISNLVAIVGVLVVIEQARRGFKGASGRSWAIGTVAVLAIAGAALALWGPWPSWKTLTERSLLGTLRTMQMTADKGAMLEAILAIELLVLVVLFGRRFHAGWRTHVQKIVIGLSTVGIAQLGVRGIWQSIVLHTMVRSRDQYEHLLDLRDRLFHASSVVFLCALVWWIAWLWVDETGSKGASEQDTPGPAGNETAGNEGIGNRE